MSETVKVNDPGGSATMTFEIIHPTISVTRDVWGYSHDSDAISQSPGPVCSALAGIQTLATDGTLNWYFTGNFDIWCTWLYSDTYHTNARFGIKIHVPFQEFGIGTAPYWFIMCDNNPGSENIDWVEVDPKSSAYRWNEDLIGLYITAAPICSHSSIIISAIINPYIDPNIVRSEK
ncbi:hypothetical protein [Serratia sp. C2(2)]|uniref:hypothetical protein n=1 Tax=Serratia sp. C2(2) TaxID=3117678 RepID=UPI002ED5BB77|nr:hypothetical protein [Serratia sp. C2(2)]